MARQGGTFSFAHLTDPHLPLRAGDMGAFWQLAGKRLTGAVSWWSKRKAIHRPDVLRALVADIHGRKPDHIVITGDIVNISAPGEFARAASWLSTLGRPHDVTVVPGIYDAYVPVPAKRGLALWGAYLTGDGASIWSGADADFPFVRVRDGLAFVGVSTAIPMRAFLAAGRVGAAQLARLERVLKETGARGLTRIVVLHHPPGRAGIPRRKGLLDRDAFAGVLGRAGAELIIHGHTHRAVLDSIPGPKQAIPILAPASASAISGEPANWHLVTSRTTDDGLVFEVEVRGIDPQSLAVSKLGQFTLPAIVAARARLNTASSC